MDFKLKLIEERQAFSDDLDPKYILSSLSDSGVITAAECERIRSKTSKQERFNELFSLLTNDSKTIKQQKAFVNALEKEDEEGCLPYPWLAEILKPCFKLKDDVHRILVRGNVPMPVNHLLPQEDKIQRIRNRLFEASHPENPYKWVVLHGPFGSGKSSLAAEALRDNNLIKNHFSDGVYWLDFGGKIITSANELEINNYYKKIENIFKLRNSNYEFSPDDDLNYVLRNEISSKSKVLFILVEVCDRSIIETFNIGCPILVTTTDKNIMTGFNCKFIECSNDVGNAEIKLLLSQYVDCKVEELPDIVQDVCSKCGGSLLVASLIGGDMAYIGNNEEAWKDWNKKLEENGLASIESIKREDVFNVIVDCIKNNNEWKDYYCDIVIFKKGFDVPSEVLQIAWDRPNVFSIAFELYKRSFIVMKESESGSNFFCCSHDLYVDAVSEYLGKDEIKKLHKKFVDKMLKIGQTDGIFDLTKLPKDYIPSFIDYHLYQAGEFEQLEKLYLDLKFLEHKIRLMNDCRSILIDYQFYKNCFKNKKEAESFELFLQRRGKYILREEKCDIIQLALFEPNNSIVYMKAKEYANKNEGIYYDWCNKTENIHEFFDYKTLYCSNVKFGAITQDASMMALGFKSEEYESEEKLWMKVWHFPTANEFEDKTSHKDVINYCAFSSTGDYLATASADKTVKIYKIRASHPTKEKSFFKDSELCKLFVTFDGHKDEVICCSFSPDDEYVISSDIIGKTFVWKFDINEDCPPIPYFESTHSHELKKEPLRFSSFSNDGKTIGTAVYDTVILWDFEAEKGEKKKTICCNNKIIRKFIFTNDDSHILLVQDFAILLWNIENDNGQTVFSDDFCAISSCCMSSSGKIACGMKSGRVIIITKDGQKILPGHNSEILNVMFSKNETKLFSVSSNRCITQNVSIIETAPLINGNVSVVIGSELTIASARSSCSIEIRKGETVTELKLEEEISAFSLCNDGSEIVIGTVQGSVKVFNIIENHCVELPQKHSGKITYILHSKNNHSFFTCSVDATINVWCKGEFHKTLSGHKLPIIKCAEFKTCDKLLTWCQNGPLKVWSPYSGTCICTLKVPRGENITCCEISCDDKYIAAAFTNRNITVWTTDFGKVYKEFSFDDNLKCCQFSPKTEKLIVGLDNGNIVLCFLIGNTKPYVPASKHKSAVTSIRNINKVDNSDGVYFLSASKSIKLRNDFGRLLQTILFPNSSMADECAQVWPSDNFDIFVVTLNSILYKLRRICRS